MVLMWIRIYRLIEMMSSWVDHNHFTHGGHDWLRRDQATSIGCGQKFESGFVQSWSVNFYSLLPPCFQLTNTSWPWTSLVECDDGSNFDLSVATFHNHLGWYKPSSPRTKEVHVLTLIFQFILDLFLERPIGYFIWEVYMPATFIVAMSFTR